MGVDDSDERRRFGAQRARGEVLSGLCGDTGECVMGTYGAAGLNGSRESHSEQDGQ